MSPGIFHLKSASVALIRKFCLNSGVSSFFAARVFAGTLPAPLTRSCSLYFNAQLNLSSTANIAAMYCGEIFDAFGSWSKDIGLKKVAKPLI